MEGNLQSELEFVSRVSISVLILGMGISIKKPDVGLIDNHALKELNS